jgi:murein DD-endopeptidase MepM/ murein hydrolase activator NlpD
MHDPVRALLAVRTRAQHGGMPRPPGTRAGVALLALAVLLLVPAPAQASRANVAALQSALTRLHLYKGFVDGIKGPLTRKAVVRFQRRRGLVVDGIAGPQTRHALGRYGRPRLGRRVMRIGNRGWDVAALQYLLQRKGYGPGIADGIFGGLTQAAVVRAQGAAGIGVDGLAGRQTIRSLRGHGPAATDPGPGRFLRPVPGPIGDGFGAPRAGGREHQGVDFPVAYGTRIGAAATGTTIFAGRNYGGYGNLVVVQHALGYTTWYAHMSSITSWVGERVSPGTRLGYVGSTGYSTGPHLHFEIRRYNTPINPVPLLTEAVASSRSRARETSECSAADRAGGASAPRGSSWIARERLCKR